MNHPRIDTRQLSNETIKALMEVLYNQYAKEKGVADIIGQRQADVALEQALKIRKFLDR